MEVWHLLHAAEEVVRAGVKSFVHQVVRAVSPFRLFHLSLTGQHWWVLLFACWGFVLLLFVLLFLLVDQSLRSSCLPMTILAQLRDCHSCYDERSIDQKKHPA